MRAEAVLALDSPSERASFDTPAAVVAHSSRTRAYVTVMEGCNHVCSFCVVPRTRGRESCRPVDLILAEVRHLIRSGYREVTLLGQTVNAYRWEGMDFAGLLEAVAGVSGLERLRFTTSHPEHVDARLADALATGVPICPYVHLPVQSGSDRILARMRRGYTREGYLERVRLLREAVPGLAVSSDVIVGYPGETDEDFEQTMTLLDEARFDSLFCFTYSPRPGTTAFSEPDDVPALVKRARLARLNAHQQQAQARRNAVHVGKQVDVLIEGRARDGSLEGRTPHFQIVHLQGDDSLIGSTVAVRIEVAGANALRGLRVA
jgi:tRNA-2-methylthio-N6-dimethylallyladenosine synthase